MRVALEKGVEVVSVNDPFIDLAYMVITLSLLLLLISVVVQLSSGMWSQSRERLEMC